METLGIYNHSSENATLNNVKNELLKIAQACFPNINDFYENEVISEMETLGKFASDRRKNSLKLWAGTDDEWDSFHAAIAYGKLSDIERRPEGYKEIDFRIHTNLQLWGAIQSLEETYDKRYAEFAETLKQIA